MIILNTEQEKYIIDSYKNNISMYKLAKEFNIDRSRVRRILEKNNIILRTKKEINKIQDMSSVKKLDGLENNIIKEYLANFSIIELKNKYNVTFKVIKRILNEGNIEIRDLKEAIAVHNNNYTRMSIEGEKYLNGWLLGDGTINKQPGNQTGFSISSIHSEYINWIHEIFIKNNIHCALSEIISKINNYKNNKQYKSKKQYKLTTESTLEFKELRNKWYPEGTKIVPKDLELSNELIQTWIMDDGTRNKNDGTLILCTQGFTKEDNKFLINKLNNFIGIECTRLNSGGENYYKIVISRIGTNILLDKIGRCPVTCFEYKWIKKILKREEKEPLLLPEEK